MRRVNIKQIIQDPKKKQELIDRVVKTLRLPWIK